jgi:2',3'-cyclic-nucleotide 2'-phosphodiesterase (5'-nucleotidase family)
VTGKAFIHSTGTINTSINNLEENMKLTRQPLAGLTSLVALSLALGTFSNQVCANGPDATLIMMGDLHGTLVPHAAIITDPDGNEREVASAGGLVRLKTVVDGIRADNPHAVLLSAGDLTHGSAETLFTVGDAMMVAMNAFDIDVFTPGNWDFGYGPAVFRNRFASKPPFPTIPPNIRVMARYVGCDDVPEAYDCTEYDSATPPPAGPPPLTPKGDGVIRANFKAVAVNLYNDAPVPNRNRVLDPYVILDRNGLSIAVIGITAAIVPQQADVFNIGLRFTQGVDELPGIIEEAWPVAEPEDCAELRGHRRDVLGTHPRDHPGRVSCDKR